jgi:parallel beta-helix repeat protein
MTFRGLKTALACLLLAGALLPGQVSAPALKASVAGGAFVVNSDTDADVRDSVLSLREAMNVAAGATGPFTPQERSQLGGCAFNAGGTITGGCGAGGDTITFSPPLTQIILTSNLPQIIKDGVTINGAVSAGTIIINANAAVNYGFRVNANQVTLTDLTIINTNGVGNPIRLENNLWMGLQIYNSYIGVLPGSTSCDSASGITSRPYYAILLLGGSGMSGAGLGTAYIDNNVIGCAANDGIANQDAPYVYVGRNVAGGSAGNWIGVSRGGATIGNNGRGVSVCCESVTGGFVAQGNRIALNGLEGVYVKGTPAGTVNDNDIFGNAGAGIHLINSSSMTLTNNLAHANGSSGIWLDQTSPTPRQTRDNRIVGGAYFRNGAAGISEHANADANTWSQISTYANQGLGIDKKDNGTPDLPQVTLSSITPVTQGAQVSGTVTSEVQIGNTYRVELYRIAPDPSGKGEGRSFVGFVNLFWNFAGNYGWTILDPSGPGCYTATLTESSFTSSVSSEFSPNLGTLCAFAHLPFVLR